MRRVGRKIVGEATLAVSRSLSVDQAERISRGVDAAIRAYAPEAEITLTATPCALDDETVIERTRLVAGGVLPCTTSSRRKSAGDFRSASISRSTAA